MAFAFFALISSVLNRTKKLNNYLIFLKIKNVLKLTLPTFFPGGSAESCYRAYSGSPEDAGPRHVYSNWIPAAPSE